MPDRANFGAFTYIDSQNVHFTWSVLKKFEKNFYYTL